MARTFGGVSTDKVATTLTAHAAQRSWSIWSYRTGDGGSSNGRMWDKNNGTASENFFNNSGSTAYSFNRNFASGSNQWDFTRPATGAWHHFLITYDSGSTSNDPIIYMDGASQALTKTVATGSGAAVTTADAYHIGNNGAGSRNWAGHIAGLAVWDRLLSAAEANLLAKGLSPIMIPISLVEYIPLVRDLISYKNAAPTATGTVIVEHPRIIMPTAGQMMRFAVNGADGAGAVRYNIMNTVGM